MKEKPTKNCYLPDLDKDARDDLDSKLQNYIRKVESGPNEPEGLGYVNFVTEICRDYSRLRLPNSVGQVLASGVEYWRPSLAPDIDGPKVLKFLYGELPWESDYCDRLNDDLIFRELIAKEIVLSLFEYKIDLFPKSETFP